MKAIPPAIFSKGKDLCVQLNEDLRGGLGQEPWCPGATLCPPTSANHA
jgi:hypothetical protein